MNLLVKRLHDPSRVFDLANLQVDRVSGSELAVVLLEVAPEVFQGGVDPLNLERALEGAFLPFVDYQRWELALEQAGAGGSPEQSEGHPREWVTMVRDNNFRGVLLPDDDAEDETASVFAWISGARKALKFMRRGSDVHMLVNLGNHCSLPDEAGRCEPGLCGECEPQVQEIHGPGICCSCRH